MAAEDALSEFANLVGRTKAFRNGTIAFRLSGKDGGEFFIERSGGETQVHRGMPQGRALIEVMGDASRVLPMLAGRKDARATFLAGGFRIRGDIQYISDLANELGVLHQPI